MSTYKIEKFDKKMQALYSLQELFLYLTVKLPASDTTIVAANNTANIFFFIITLSFFLF